MAFDDDPKTQLNRDDQPAAASSIDDEGEQRRRREQEDMLDLIRWGSDGGANCD